MRKCTPKNIEQRKFLSPDSNAAYFASRSYFFTPTVTDCPSDIRMTPLKGKDGGLLLIYVVNNTYFPVIDLN